MIFQAAIHGVDLEKAVKKLAPVPAKNDGVLFGDPKDYEKMNPAERETKTKQMMEHWKAWADSNPIPTKG